MSCNSTQFWLHWLIASNSTRTHSYKTAFHCKPKMLSFFNFFFKVLLLDHKWVPQGQKKAHQGDLHSLQCQLNPKNSHREGHFCWLSHVAPQPLLLQRKRTGTVCSNSPLSTWALRGPSPSKSPLREAATLGCYLCFWPTGARLMAPKTLSSDLHSIHKSRWLLTGYKSEGPTIPSLGSINFS